MTIKRALLTTVSSLAMLGTASAADLGIRKAPPPLAAPTFAGWYVGISGGVVRHDWSFTQESCIRLDNGNTCDFLLSAGTNPAVWTDSKTGGIFGVHVGYNWQSSSLVYGVEADWSWLGVSKSIGPLSGKLLSKVTLSTKIDWLATFRGRAGLAVDRTMIYLTGGAAVAKVENGWNGDKHPNGEFLEFGNDSTRWGWVAGVGLEHMWTPNWVLRAEVLHVDLLRKTQQTTENFGDHGTTSGTAFTNKLLIGRVGLSWKW